MKSFLFVLLVVFCELVCSCTSQREEITKVVSANNKYIIEIKPLKSSKSGDSIVSYIIHITAQDVKGLLGDTLKIRGVEKRKYYFDYHFGKDITLEQDGQLYSPKSFHFEAGSSISNKYNFFVFFKVPRTKEVFKRKIIINSPVLVPETLNFILATNN